MMHEHRQQARYEFLLFANQPKVFSKTALKNRGWSQRRAAAVLGVTQTQLNLVLCGKRESARLLRAVTELPPCPAADIPKNSLYRKEVTA
jgi:transcriptional regulator with XRE-family HTH domain